MQSVINSVQATPFAKGKAQKTERTVTQQGRITLSMVTGQPIRGAETVQPLPETNDVTEEVPEVVSNESLHIL